MTSDERTILSLLANESSHVKGHAINCTETLDLASPLPTRLECSYSPVDKSMRFPVCWFHNMYYDPVKNVYLALRLEQRSPISWVKHFDSFDTLKEIQELPQPVTVTSVIQPTILAQPPHPNYCHGFLEDLYCLFFESLVMQNRSFSLDTSHLVFWISRTTLFREFPSNWDNFVKQEDGRFHYKFSWREQVHRAFSDCPLEFFGRQTSVTTLVHFKQLLVPSHCPARTVFVNRHGFNHPSRTFQYEPYPERAQGRYMLLFGDYLLRRFGVRSRFDVGGYRFEQENITITPRRGAGKREILNAGDLIEPLQSVTALTVIEYEFTEMQETMQILRSTRLLITPHGAGMSNLVFMRPGASVLETDGFMCGIQGDYYGQLARILSLNHRVWVQLKRTDSSESCNFQGHITLDIDQVVTAARDMLAQESFLREGHMNDAMQKVLAHVS